MRVVWLSIFNRYLMFFAYKCSRASAHWMYGSSSLGVGVGGVLLSGSFYMCPTVECILCSENVYTAHYMKQSVVK